MARLLNAATSDYLEVDRLIADYPFTMAGWFYQTAGGTVTLFFVGDSRVTNHYHRLIAQATPSRLRVDSAVGGTASGINCPVVHTLNEWHHAVLMVVAPDDRRLYLDGGNMAQATVSRAPAGMNRTSIGRMGTSSPTAYWPGRVAEVGYWSAALSDAEIVALAVGTRPSGVRPEALVAYWPILGEVAPEPDTIGDAHLTVVGTTQAEHPPMASASRPWLFRRNRILGGGLT